MKVSTDSCLLGAFTAAHIKHTPTRILDIGSGTGLLSLMIAQKVASPIDAVELDEQAAVQLRENIAQSPWANRVQVYADSIQTFSQQTEQQYEVIICNPPFYPNHFKSPSATINRARHTDQLSFGELVAAVQQLLNKKGTFYLLLPPQQQLLFAEIAQATGLYCHESLTVQARADSAVIRVISVWKKEEKEHTQQALIIRNQGNQYTTQFESLLSDYYLIFD